MLSDFHHCLHQNDGQLHQGVILNYGSMVFKTLWQRYTKIYMCKNEIIYLEVVLITVNAILSMTN